MLIKAAEGLEKYLFELVQRQTQPVSFEQAQSAQINNYQHSCISTFHDFVFLLDDVFATDACVALFHDLRLNTERGIGHIDHLVVTRFLDVFIIESHYYGDELEINEREEFFACYADGRKIAIRSPFTQLRRNLAAVQSVFKQLGLPKKYGELIVPQFHRYIALSPETRLNNQSALNSNGFIQPKALVKNIYKAAHRSLLSTTFYSVSPVQLREMMHLVTDWHDSRKVDFIAKYRAVAAN